MFQSEFWIKIRPWLKWLCFGFWIMLFVGIISSILLFSIVLKEDLPGFNELENPNVDLATIIYDVKGRSFGKYYVENRERIQYSEISPHVYDALIATEDERFFSHSGIDLRALFRVGFKTVLLSKESSGGGSTITQQLSKLLFDRPSTRGMSKIARIFSLIKVKLKEWIVASRLEKQYTKEEILTMYLNQFEFINGAHGIQAAAQIYFGKNQKDLSVEEGAVLVGMLKNPSLYNPARFTEKAKLRRNVVLSQMKKYGRLTQTEFDSISTLPLNMENFTRDRHDTGLAPHFRAELTKWVKQILEDDKIVKPDGSKYNIYTDGLKIHTTIDLHYQRIAEEAAYEHMKWNQKRYFNVWKGMNPWTYDANEEQADIRLSVLNRRAKESDRYLDLHNKYLGSIKASLSQEYGDIPLNENVIKNLIAIKEKTSSWSKAKEEKVFKTAFVDQYKKLISSSSFEDLANNYNGLQKEYDQVFSTKIPMKIFDYNEDRQKEVEMSPMDSVKYHNQHLQCGVLAVDPGSGHIKAWVGGVDFKYFKYDHVTANRLVGSTIKPFVYATAISLQGISPCKEYPDIQYTIVPGDDNLWVDAEWSPANANGTFTGNAYNLYQGLLYSKNSISVRLVKEMGSVDIIRDVLRNAGIDVDADVNGRYAVPRVPSICLGAVDLSLLDMTGAYTIFPNQGSYTEPIFVTHIEDKNGRTLYTSIPERKQALNPLYNAVMVDMLRNNVGGRFGMGVKSKIGGKTGTTNDYADGWFMGISPNLVVGSWVGGDDQWIRFLSLEDGQGFVMARPIVQKFFEKLEVDSLAQYDSSLDFPKAPPGFYDLIDCDKYKQIKPEEEQLLREQTNSQYDEFDSEFEEDLNVDEIEEEFDEEFDEEF